LSVYSAKFSFQNILFLDYFIQTKQKQVRIPFCHPFLVIFTLLNVVNPDPHGSTLIGSPGSGSVLGMGSVSRSGSRSNEMVKINNEIYKINQ
jgi:hypothetical protein